jgi:hypothetical protein
VLELAHGISRADTAERRDRRQRFLDELLTGVPIQPVTVRIALRAGQIDGHRCRIIIHLVVVVLRSATVENYTRTFFFWIQTLLQKRELNVRELSVPVSTPGRASSS